MEKRTVALSIAGSDSSGGAGIQADMKSFSVLGVHGLTVITCVTAQNTQRVHHIHPVSVENIEQQIDAVYEDFSINAVKTGMLYSDEIVGCVAKKISKYHMKPVVDPVMIATSGDRLSQKTFLETLKKELLPKTYILTPNIPEAEMLLGKTITSLEEMQNACKKLHDLGPKHIFLKGGHLENDDATDVFFDGKKISTFSLPRIPLGKTHGSGCTLSALITGYLALEETSLHAAQKAKIMTWTMINNGFRLGKGATLLNQSLCIYDVPPLCPSIDHFCVWLELKTMVDRLLSVLPKEFVPEVGMNIGYAVIGAMSPDEICAIEGRIVKTRDCVLRHGRLDFGVSKHIASIILTVMSIDMSMRCAMNIRYSQENLNLCRNVGLTVGSFDRKNEPANASSTMEWGTKDAIVRLNGIPDIIYDTGSVGKEPMIRLLGKNPSDVLRKMQCIIGKTGEKLRNHYKGQQN